MEPLFPREEAAVFFAGPALAAVDLAAGDSGAAAFFELPDFEDADLEGNVFLAADEADFLLAADLTGGFFGAALFAVVWAAIAVPSNPKITAQ